MEEAIIAVGSIIIGALLSRWLSKAERTSAARDEFLLATADLRAKLDEMRGREEEFLTQSLTGLRQSIYRLGKRARDWQGLNRVWTEYQATRNEDLRGGRGAVEKALGGKDWGEKFHELFDKLDDHAA